MHKILEKLLKRAGYVGIDQMTPEEKVSFKLIEERLNASRPATIDEWKDFLRGVIEELIKEFEPDQSEKKKIFLWAQLALCRKLLSFAERDEKEEAAISREYNLE